jgi:hypothetical protein
VSRLEQGTIVFGFLLVLGMFLFLATDKDGKIEKALTEMAERKFYK